MIRNANTAHRERLTRLDKVAVWTTRKVGAMGFFLLIVVWTVIWLGWNMFCSPNLCFDPAPAFVVWLFISNMIQILLMPLIMVGQRLQGKHSEVRAEVDHETLKEILEELQFLNPGRVK